ncbi:MAG TPA: phage tail sheath subtilisin-like domain-containing protein [Blastocatellia bacterium]|nr:phage tail sheath subtilisin-like domain-containing protein [Blastocatellia bacterium]
MAFTATNKAPGVYIDEIQVPGAIAGVSTSIAAFVGPARRGPMNKAVFLTSWTQFVNQFGPQDPQDPQGPFIIDPQVWVAHAVRGFFDNGGPGCYFVRVGTGVQASLALADRSAAGRDTLVVKAKQEGAAGNSIQVEVQNANIIASVAAVREEITLVSASNKQATAANDADAAKFRPGDIVFLSEGANNDRVTVDRVTGATITLRETLTHAYTPAGTLRIADLNPGQRRIRLADTTGIEAGSYVSLTAGATTEGQVVQSVERANNSIILGRGLTNLFSMAAADPAVNLSTLEFTLILQTPGVEAYPNLSMDPRHSRFFANIVNSQFVDVALVDPPNPTTPPDNLPAPLGATPLANGVNDDLAQLRSPAFAPRFRAGIDALERVDNVSILCVPDRTDQDIQAYMIAHCEKMQDRFAILDPGRNIDPTGAQTQRDLLNSDGGYAALYYPRIVIPDPLGNGRVTIPPSGHVAGLYARTDNDRGVFKAPANDTLRGVVDLERTLTDGEQGPLNEIGVNVIRFFTGRGIRVWGARTISTSVQWRYVNVRRLLLFIEESIQEGTQFAVFEPNNIELWGKVKRQVTDFLTRLWSEGALFGATADDAFSVRIDEDLNPPSVRQLGQLIIEVKLFPTTPAEFVVFRIIQQPGGPVVQE